MTKPLPPNIKLVRDLFEEDKVSLSKQDLATLISKQNGITFAQASRELDHVLGGMSDALVAGHGLELRGFASFTLRKTRAIPARNPRTMEPAMIPARWKVMYRCSTLLRKMLQHSLG